MLYSMDPITNLIRCLTYAGLVPLLLLNLLNIWTPGPWIQWMVFYVAIIISFISGMQWGISLELERSPWVLLTSVLCSLWAWSSLLLSHTTFSIISQIVALLCLYYIDTSLIPEDAYPVDYTITRKRATVCIMILLVVPMILPLQ